jgi:hypothetical protein
VAVYLLLCVAAHIQSSLFDGNAATFFPPNGQSGNGGALYVQGQIQVIGTTFQNNTVTTGVWPEEARGGAISVVGNAKNVHSFFQNCRCVHAL